MIAFIGGGWGAGGRLVGCTNDVIHITYITAVDHVLLTLYLTYL